MRSLLFITAILFGTIEVLAQTNSQATEGSISINAIVADESIPTEAAHNLKTKLKRALTVNGVADNGYTERFVLTAKVDVTSKDIAPTTPPRISQKMEVTFMIGDVIENKLYEACTIPLAGIGVNETKAYITAFSKINPKHKDLLAMIERAKEKIRDYYTNHCGEIIRKAQTLRQMQRYDEAIFMLTSVPNVCNDCFQQCMAEAEKVYVDKINSEGMEWFNQAQNVWMKQPDAVGAAEVAAIISQINPKSSVYNKVEALRKEVSAKLAADEKKEWDFQMKKYDDNQQFKRSIVEACKAIGVAFGNGQPQNVTKNVINRW